MAIKGGINHITLCVKSLQRAESFYCGLLGLNKVGARPGMGFYSSGQYNHELALIEDPSFNQSDNRHSGLVHIAFNVENTQALSDLYHELVKAGQAVSAGVDHIISRSFYTSDPDGYAIEITTDTSTQDWSQNPSAFKQDYSVDL